MTLAEKQANLIARLSGMADPQSRLALLVEQARQQQPLPEQFKTESYQVEGCLSKLWLVPEFRDGLCHFRTDSDSLIVKAVAGMLCDLCSGQPPAEILAADPSFLGPLGITQHLSQNRRNGLARVWEKLRTFAQAHAS